MLVFEELPHSMHRYVYTPLTTEIKNVNSLLGSNGIIGVKTGNSDAAGGAYISASRVVLNQKPVVIVTAILGSATLSSALKDSLPLVKSAQANFETVSIVKAGQSVGSVKVPWDGNISAVAEKDLTTAVWNGSQADVAINLKPVSIKDIFAGSISLPNSAVSNYQTVKVKLDSHPTPPNIWWRLIHPIK